MIVLIPSVFAISTLAVRIRDHAGISFARRTRSIFPGPTLTWSLFANTNVILVCSSPFLISLLLVFFFRSITQVCVFVSLSFEGLLFSWGRVQGVSFSINSCPRAQDTPGGHGGRAHTVALIAGARRSRGLTKPRAEGAPGEHGQQPHRGAALLGLSN